MIQKGDRVAVAMSGGVDSSVVAAMAYEAGYDVVGITLQLYDHGRVAVKKGSCCAGQDIYDARTVADAMGFPHYVLDYESVFQESVMEDFVQGYLRGETPLPCVRCNQKVKFRDLLTTAQDLGAKALFTGHYVQRQQNTQGVWELHRGADPVRDQSYFLFATTRAQLDYLDFPLGGLPKSVTREHAKRLGLVVSDKPDSQDICFIPNGDYRTFVTKWAPQASVAGEIVHVDGRILGEHPGIVGYTIGQRRGLGIAWPEPLYVVRVEADTHRVIVGPKEALACTKLHIKDVNWLYMPQPTDGVSVKIRSSQEPVPACVVEINGETATVVLQQSEYGVSPGQACVVYKGTQVLGGGWITNAN